jgi:hypothetical protein
MSRYTGPLATGGDFYNYFVLGLQPASYNSSYVEPDPSDNSTAPDTNSTSTPDPYDLWKNNSYPDTTIVQQEDLGSDGSVTGYFFEDISTAVLSIPSFSSDIDTFSDAVKYFVGNATEKRAKKVIIDLQQNKGGQVALALDTYRWVRMLKDSQSPMTS